MRSRVIAELLGVPASDRYLLPPWSADMCCMYELHTNDEDRRAATRASVEFSDYPRVLSRERRAADEGAEIQGVRVPRGAELGLLFGSANRDPATFETPDELWLDRDPGPQRDVRRRHPFLSRAPLARPELQTSFATVLRRLPRFEVVVEPEWRPGYISRGLRSLRVAA